MGAHRHWQGVGALAPPPGKVEKCRVKKLDRVPEVYTINCPSAYANFWQTGWGWPVGRT